MVHMVTAYACFCYCASVEKAESKSMAKQQAIAACYREKLRCKCTKMAEVPDYDYLEEACKHLEDDFEEVGVEVV